MASLKLVAGSDRIEGKIMPPASKSISNRALIIQALTANAFDIYNLSSSGDSMLMVKLLNSGDYSLDTGNSGTVCRFLTAYYALQGMEKIIDGHQRMRERPVVGLVSALNDLGAEITYLAKAGFLPIKISGKKPDGGNIKLDMSQSSQFISALLMIAPLLNGGLHVDFKNKPVSASYIDMTLQLLIYWGIECEFSADHITIKQQPYKPKNIFIEPDWSSVSYIYNIASLFTDIDIELRGLQEFSIQGDSVTARVMEQFGIRTVFKNNSAFLIRHEVQKPVYFHYDFTNNPDLLTGFAVLCLCHKVPFRFTGISTLRSKESDRIQSLKEEFIKFNVFLADEKNVLSCDSYPENEWPGGIAIDSHGDHRIILSFATAACMNHEISLNDFEVISKSYPSFWKDLAELGIRIEKMR